MHRQTFSPSLLHVCLFSACRNKQLELLQQVVDTCPDHQYPLQVLIVSGAGPAVIGYVMQQERGPLGALHSRACDGS
jgi:hypothetical protein